MFLLYYIFGNYRVFYDLIEQNMNIAEITNDNLSISYKTIASIPAFNINNLSIEDLKKKILNYLIFV